MANRGYNLCLLNYYLWNETGKLFENSSEMWSGDEYFVVYSPWKRSVRQIPPLYCLKWTSDNAGQRVLCFLDRQKEVGWGRKASNWGRNLVCEWGEGFYPVFAMYFSSSGNCQSVRRPNMTILPTSTLFNLLFSFVLCEYPRIFNVEERGGQQAIF